MVEPTRVLLDIDDVTLSVKSLRRAIAREDAMTVMFAGSAVVDVMAKLSVTAMDVTYNRSLSVASVDGALLYVNDEALEKLLDSTIRDVVDWARATSGRTHDRSTSTKPNATAHIANDPSNFS